MTDAMDMFRAMRPEAPSPHSPDIRRQVSVTNGQVDYRSLAMVPGTPGYNSRIPKPPCYQCGEDHHPGVDYGHPWVGDPVHADAPVSAAPRHAAPTPEYVQQDALPQQDPVILQRVALYVGRGDTYVIAVERAPDWDGDTTFKITPEMVVPMIQLVRGLGIRVVDKTGGDLVMLTQEYGDGRRQHAQADVRGAESPRSNLARRQGPDADQPPADPEEGAAAADRRLPEPAGERPDPAG